MASLEGYLERFEGGRLIGWAWNRGADAPAEIELLVDGERAGRIVADEPRPDLAGAGIGTGSHGFSWRLPLKFHDGSSHRFEAVLAGSHGTIPGTFDTVVPAPRWEMAIGVDGRLAGYLLNPMDPTEVLEVTLMMEGVLVERATACEAVRTGLFEDAPSAACGFSFELPAASLTALSSVSVLAPALERTLAAADDLISRTLRLRLVSEDEMSVVARLSTPLKLSREPVEFTLDGVLAASAPFVRTDTGSIASARLWFDAPLAAEQELELTARLSGGSQAARLWFSRGDAGLFSTDPRFESWTGEAPAAWRVGGGRVWRVPVAAAAGEETPASALRILRPGDQAVDLAQTFEQPAAVGLVDVLLMARVQAGGRVEISLSGPTADGQSWTVRRAVTLWEEWTERVLRLETPTEAVGGAWTLAMTTLDPIGGWLDIARFGCGDEGARAIPGFAAEARASDARAWNAVRGGDFEGWAPPWTRLIGRGRTGLAPGWAAYAKAAEPELQARLQGVELPAFDGANERRAGFGLRLRAASLSGPVRLEAELDARALAGDAAERLSFYLASPTLTPGYLGRVLVVSRSLGGDQTVATLLAGSPVARDGGGYVTRSVAVGATALVREAARSCRTEPDLALWLVFEFEASGALDVVLADVRFGSAPGTLGGVLKGRVAVEDPNIAAQLATTRLVERWAIPDRLSPPGRGDSFPRRSPVWRWSSPATSVDVVVCVHNALEESLACLASLRENTTVPHTLTVVDDASDGVTRAALERAAAAAPWVRVIRNSENLGYTRSANFGLSQSAAEWVVLLNSDTLVTAGWLEGMLECASSDERIAMVGPISNAASWQSVPELFLDDGRWKVNGFGELDANGVADLVRSLSNRAFPRVPLLNGFCTLMRRSVVQAIGGFDEEVFPVGYGEENDLCVRVGQAGHALAIADHVYIHHAKSASFGAARRAELSRRGNAACAAKHPEVDFRKLQRELAECVPLIELRRKLETALGASADAVAA